MGLIVRVPYVSGNDVTAEGQNTNEDLIVAEVNGNIQDVNVAALAAIQGSKLADAPNGVPTSKINDLAVTTVKLGNLAVTAAKIAPLVIGKDKLNSIELTTNFTMNFTGVGLSGAVYAIRVTPVPATPSIAGMMPLAIFLKSVSGTGGVLVQAVVSLQEDVGGGVYYIVGANVIPNVVSTVTGTIVFRYLTLV